MQFVIASKAEFTQLHYQIVRYYTGSLREQKTLKILVYIIGIDFARNPFTPNLQKQVKLESPNHIIRFSYIILGDRLSNFQSTRKYFLQKDILHVICKEIQNPVSQLYAHIFLYLLGGCVRLFKLCLFCLCYIGLIMQFTCILVYRPNQIADTSRQRGKPLYHRSALQTGPSKKVCIYQHQLHESKVVHMSEFIKI